MRLAIILLTYDRLNYAERTLRTLASNLLWSGELRLHIADDGSPDAYRCRLHDLARELFGVPVTVTNTERRGYGASYNAATMAVHESSDLILPLEDDWTLTRPLDADHIAAVLADRSAGFVGMVRLGYLGFVEPILGSTVHLAGGTYLLLDPASPSHDVAAGHPRIETVEWARRVGPWTEGLDPGQTERDWTGRPAARRGVLWPLDVSATGNCFCHIGTVQARVDQR